MERVSEDLIRAWEDAYRRYGSAAGANVAPASRAVALAWRDIASTSRLPWWVLAAVESAAEAFEDQAEQWEARARAGKPWQGVPNTREPGDTPVTTSGHLPAMDEAGRH
ncbi:MAG TPA: hypothetical protein VJT49_17515 [Amycolatopsis sp.]|uniref:hypothetical protein n=1 Tax=Amycolatopsis sp. TaxID=37632 RepID=UPI002B48DB98|nr:hypothetical protein [Amycolatopsis sp.]HKS46869.1 hypothetical protein [Amycolatopsis sp.]